MEARFAALDGPHRRGDAAEAITKAEFVTRGFEVLEPTTDNSRYDFVIEVDDRLLKMQSKTAFSSTDGTVAFDTISTRVKNSGYDRDGYEGEIDYFVVFNPILDETYLVHIDEAAAQRMEIRYVEPKRNQWAGVNWHEDYRLEARLPEL